MQFGGAVGSRAWILARLVWADVDVDDARGLQMILDVAEPVATIHLGNHRDAEINQNEK